MPNAQPSSWRMLLPLAAVLLLALLWSIYWFLAAGYAKDRFAEERTRLEAQGVTLACQSESWGGYPFHFEFTCSSPVVKVRDRGEITSAKVLLTALAYAPNQIVALLDGPSTVTRNGDQPITANHQRAIAAITFARDRNPKVINRNSILVGGRPWWCGEGNAPYQALRGRRNRRCDDGNRG